MSKLDDLTKVAAGLSDQQLDGLLDYAWTLADERYFENAPPEAREAIERGLSQYRAGATEAGGDALRRLRHQLDGARKAE